MKVFKQDIEAKRVIFNVRGDLAERLDKAKSDARKLGRKLDIDGAVDEALEKFLKKAEKKLADMLHDAGEHGLDISAIDDGQGQDAAD